MIDKLKQIEDKLMLELLSSEDIWQTLLIDDNKPLVERLWTQINKYRISLNFIHSCEKDVVSHLTNPWPCSIHIIQGSCEIGVGYSNNEKNVFLAPQGNFYCDMNNKDTVYYIRSTNSASSVVMLSGEPWDEKTIKSKDRKTIDYTRKKIILEYFSNYYRSYYQNERTKDNITIQRGDWVEFDKNLMSEYDKKGYVSILNMRGFVIKATDTLVDARFGNDRFQIKSCFLKKLYVSDVQNPVESTKPLSGKVDDDDDDDDFDPDFL